MFGVIFSKISKRKIIIPKMKKKIFSLIYDRRASKTASFKLKNVKNEREVRNTISAVVRKPKKCSIY